jgi:tRNA pseudouridine38-40 synthase
LKLTIAYAGAGFRGWARQPGARTVEETLRDGLSRLYDSVGPLQVAGRTDAGVHALANVVSVEVSGGPPDGRALVALNAQLPRDLAVTAVEQAPPAFHARHSATSRSYRYRIWRAPVRSPFEDVRALWRPQPLDVQRLEACAAHLPGEHDFRAFTPTETQHRAFQRTVLAARWIERGEALEFEITADAFLHRMVRTLVGTMLTFEPEPFAALLHGAHRSQAGVTSPARGLTLIAVCYEPRAGRSAAHPSPESR